METKESNINFSKEIAILTDWNRDLDTNIKSLTKIVKTSELRSKLVFAESSSKVFPLRSILGIASAMAVILFSVVLLQPKNSILEGSFSTQTSKQGFNLNDGTEVVLDKSSALKPITKRTVEFDGRGYFSVESSPSNPFNIETTAGLVQVLGTQFSLEVNDDVLELYVTEGIVRFEKDGKSAMVYEGGFIKVKDGNISLVNKLPNNYLSWFNDEIYFRSAHSNEIINTLNNHFNLDLTPNDIVEGKSAVITSKFKNPDLQSVLHELAKNGLVIDEKAL